MSERRGYHQWPMSVAAVDRPAECVRRFTFRADEFATMPRLGVDESFGLMMPLAGKQFVMPDAGRLNARSAIQAMPEETRPEMRWYSIRALDAERGELTADVVLHGDSGPGSAWAARAESGEIVGFRSGAAEYVAPLAGENQLLIADETAVPALAAIADSLADTSGVEAIIEIPDQRYLAELDLPIPLTVLRRGNQPPGRMALDRLVESPPADVRSAWVCGESGMVTGLRRHLVTAAGLDRRSVHFSGYWKVGRARL